MSNIEDISQIKFEYEGTTYIMEFDRETAAQAEKTFDVSISDVKDGKISAFEALFHCSFLKHHPNIKQSTVEKFYSLMPNKQEIFKNLAIMYGNCINSLFDEPDEGKAIRWEAQ